MNVVVESKGFVTESSDTQLTIISKGSSVITTNTTPESWFIKVFDGKDVVKCEVAEDIYNIIKTDSKAIAKIRYGRFSGNSICDGITTIFNEDLNSRYTTTNLKLLLPETKQ